jgi:hypothetical protein
MDTVTKKYRYFIAYSMTNYVGNAEITFRKKITCNQDILNIETFLATQNGVQKVTITNFILFEDDNE